MIRRRNKKLIAGESDAPLYFDLQSDPVELRNLANDPVYEAEVRSLLSEIHSKWDVPAIKQRVVESQRRRHTVIPTALEQNLCWDYQPETNAGDAYIRNNLELYEIERRSRFPAVK